MGSPGGLDNVVGSKAAAHALVHHLCLSVCPGLGKIPKGKCPVFPVVQLEPTLSNPEPQNSPSASSS